VQSDTTAVLALLLAHLLGDFPLQTGRMVAGKTRGEAGGYVAHLCVHLALAVGALLAFTQVPLDRLETGLALVVLGAGHGLLDVAKSWVIRSWPAADGGWLFAGDQLAHVAVVVLAASLLPGAELAVPALAGFWRLHRARVLIEGVVLLATVFPAGYLIRHLLRPLSTQLSDRDDVASQGLANAGLYLGWIERTLLLFAFAQGSIAAIGLVVGAKSVARFPEFRDRAFAEYFLLGTLLSVGFAGLGGVALRLARASL